MLNFRGVDSVQRPEAPEYRPRIGGSPSYFKGRGGGMKGGFPWMKGFPAWKTNEFSYDSMYIIPIETAGGIFQQSSR